MRSFFDSILDWISATSLTDVEFAMCTSTMPLYDQGTYDDLAKVLASRESVSTSIERLTAYYKSKGVELTVFNTAKSEILIGMPL